MGEIVSIKIRKKERDYRYKKGKYQGYGREMINLERKEKKRRDEVLANMYFITSFRVLVTSDTSGLIETIRNTISIHSIKKDAYTRGWNPKGAVFTLNDYYEKVGPH